MGKRVRADAELVRRGLARSREEASAYIRQGKVSIGGIPVAKPASQVEFGAPLIVEADSNAIDWASRGAHKLLGALEAFGTRGLTVRDCRCLDAGASTGGFTDVLLHEGAREVVAVDVGYGQLIWRLQSDDRVTVIDRTNVRGIDAEAIGGPVDVVVADLSFISLKLVLDALLACSKPGTSMMLMVKPQFEVGKERVGAGGVVRDPILRAEAVYDVAVYAQSIGLSIIDVAASPLPGPSGNVEYFLWMSVPDGATPVEPMQGEILEEMIARAVKEGPQ